MYEKPKIKEMIDWSRVIAIAEEVLDQAETGYVNDDMDHWIFETVMTVVYGDNVWKWYNEKVT